MFCLPLTPTIPSHFSLVSCLVECVSSQTDFSVVVSNENQITFHMIRWRRRKKFRKENSYIRAIKVWNKIHHKRGGINTFVAFFSFIYILVTFIWFLPSWNERKITKQYCKGRKKKKKEETKLESYSVKGGNHQPCVRTCGLIPGNGEMNGKSKKTSENEGKNKGFIFHHFF